MQRNRNTVLLLLTLVLAFAMDEAIVRRARGHVAAIGTHRSLQSLPLGIGGKKGSPEALPQEILSALGSDDYLLRQYRGGAVPLTLFIASYGHQRSLYERIHSPSVCLPAGGWLPVETGYQMIPIADRPAVTANRYLVQKGSQRLAVLYWFAGRSRVIANDMQAALYLHYDTLLGRGSDESLVRVSGPVQRSVQATLADEVRFIQALYPELQRVFAVR